MYLVNSFKSVYNPIFSHSLKFPDLINFLEGLQRLCKHNLLNLYKGYWKKWKEKKGDQILRGFDV